MTTKTAHERAVKYTHNESRQASTGGTTLSSMDRGKFYIKHRVGGVMWWILMVQDRAQSRAFVTLAIKRSVPSDVKILFIWSSTMTSKKKKKNPTQHSQSPLAPRCISAIHPVHSILPPFNSQIRS